MVVCGASTEDQRVSLLSSESASTVFDRGHAVEMSTSFCFPFPYTAPELRV
jgi:hypothetical protein